MSVENPLVLVCGSRTALDYEMIRDHLSQLPSTSTILHGGAKGADSLAGKAAEELGFGTVVMRADWGTYGKKAGILRNIEMLDRNPDLVLAFWDGKSRGTKHTITEASKRGLTVEIVPVGGRDE